MNHYKKIIGKNNVIKKLNKISSSKNTPNAMLFIGDKHVGKFRTAIEFTKQFFNKEEQKNQIEKNIFNDVVTIGDLWQKEKLEDWNVISKTSNFDQSHRTGKNGSPPARNDIIGILDVKKFSEKIYTSAINFKIGIIRDINRLNQESSNALLKILEEPPSKTMFILTASNKNILPTILSRCQIINFNTTKEEFFYEYAIENQIENKEDVIKFSAGKQELFFKISNCEKTLKEKIKIYEFIENKINKSSFFDIKEIEEITDKFSDSKINEILEIFNIYINENKYTLKVGKLLTLYRAVKNANQQLQANVNKKMIIENLFLCV